MQNWDRRIGTPARPWNFARKFTLDAELAALLDNQGRQGNEDDEITDQLVAQALFRERWKYRLRIGTLVWYATKRRALIWYGAMRDAVAQKFKKIAKREEAKQAEEITPDEPEDRG